MGPEKNTPAFAILFVCIQFILFDTNESDVSQIPMHQFHRVFRRCGHIRYIQDSVILMQETERREGLLKLK